MVAISSLIRFLAYAVSVLGFLPVAPHVDIQVLIAFPVALAGGIYFDRLGKHPLTGVPIAILTVISFVFYLMQLSMANPAAPAVNFLVVLLSVRLLNEKSPRNILQIFALALFALAGSSLFSLSAIFLVYLFLQLGLIAVSLVLLTFHSVDDHLSLTRRSLWRVVGVSLAMPAASVPLVLFFFAILPRTQYPLLNFLNTPGERTAGFSDRVEPGRASSVGEVKTVAFRAECEQLAPNDLYWRGIVFDTMSGATWTKSGQRSDEVPGIPRGTTVRQTVYPEPSLGNHLIALDVPIRLDGTGISQGEDFTFIKRGRPRGRIRYGATSVLTGAIPMPRGIDRAHYLRIPGHVSDRVYALAKEFSAGEPPDGERLKRVESWFVRQGFRYATSGLVVSADPVDVFLLEKRVGHCEFFASSFATLLRLAGVPARLVGGYYGGDYNEVGGYYVVTEDRAHVWVEAFVEGKGWVRIDPSSFAANFDRAQSGKRAFTTKIIALIDSFTWYWNQAVITYDLQKQVELLRRANRQFSGITIHAGTRNFLPVLLVAAALVFVARLLMIRGKRTREEQILQHFWARIEKVYGIPRPRPSQGLKEIADMIDDPAATEFVSIFGGAIYRDRQLSKDEYQQLVQIIKSIGNNGRQRFGKSV